MSHTNGYNAQDIEKLQEISDEDFVPYRKHYFKMDGWMVLPIWAVSVIAIISFCLLLFEGIEQILGVLGLLFTLFHFGYRKGQWSGYVQGFHEGVPRGVQKALQLSDEDMKNIDEINTDSKLTW